MVDSRQKEVDIEQFILDKELEFYEWYQSSSSHLDKVFKDDLVLKQHVAQELQKNVETIKIKKAELEKLRKN